MARPIKKGIEYFPLDTQFDDKIELLIAEKGAISLSILITLWQLIYSNEGYFIDYNEDLIFLIKRRLLIDETLISDVINATIKRNIFDKDLYEQYKILTSKAIQKRYFLISKKKKNLVVKKEFFLLDINEYSNIVITEITGINSEITSVNSEITGVFPEITTQIKEKKIKEKEIKENIYFENNFLQYLPEEFIPTWKQYIEHCRSAGIKFTDFNIKSHLIAFKECYLEGIDPPILFEAFLQSNHKGLYWVKEKLIKEKQNGNNNKHNPHRDKQEYEFDEFKYKERVERYKKMGFD